MLSIAHGLVGNSGTKLLGLLAVLGVHDVVQVDEVIIQYTVGNGLIERSQGGEGDAALTITGRERLDRAWLIFQRSWRRATTAAVGSKAVGGEAASLGGWVAPCRTRRGHGGNVAVLHHERFDEGRETRHIAAHAGETSAQLLNLLLEGIDLGLLGNLVAGLLDVLEQIGASTEEILVAESPVVGLLVGSDSVDADGLILHLAEPVEVELTDEGAEVVMLEVPWNNLGCERVRILDNEGCAIFTPFANVRRAIVDHGPCL